MGKINQSHKKRIKSNLLTWLKEETVKFIGKHGDLTFCGIALDCDMGSYADCGL